MAKKHIIFFTFIILLSLLFSGCIGSSPNKNYGSNNYYSSSSKTEDAKALLSKALSYEDVPEEILTPDELLSNAILDKLYITIISETSNGCSVKIKYPNVAEIFLEETQKLSLEPTEEEVNALLLLLTEKVKNNGCTMLEGTFELTFTTNENGSKSIVWSNDALHAISGGLYTPAE